MSVWLLMDRPRPRPKEERTCSFLVDCAIRCWWYSSDRFLSRLPRKEARSRFLSMCSLGCNHRCSRHSSVDGRLLKSQYSKTDSLRATLINLCCKLPRCSFEDEHKETVSLHRYLLVDWLEAEAHVRNVLSRLFLVFTPVVTKMDKCVIVLLIILSDVINYANGETPERRT